MRWTSYRSATCSGTLTLHFTSCTLKRWHAAPTKGQVPRRRLQCSPVIGMTASWQPNGHRDTGPDPSGWAPVIGSRHSRPGPLGRRGSSSGRRRRRGPALEAAKTCSQERSSSLARLFTIQQGSCVHQGTPSRLLFPVGVHHVYQMIQLEDQSLAQMHNTMLTVLGTVMCMRVNEMDQLQICDVLWHFDAAFHILDCTQPLVGH